MLAKLDYQRLSNIKKQLTDLKIEDKYNLFSIISNNENSLDIFNKNNHDHLLVSICPILNNEFRVYTDDDYLIINKQEIVIFLNNYFKDYFGY